MKLIILFIILSIINVVFSTVRTLVTVNGSKEFASLISGGYFAFYNIMLIYTVADFPLWTKCLITFICNVCGVYIVKFFEEKTNRKNSKLWRVDFTIKNNVLKFEIANKLNALDLSYSYINTKNDRDILFSVYCNSRNDSSLIKEVLKNYNVRYFVQESKTL